jgi:RND family efflux transporter MFP subunit
MSPRFIIKLLLAASLATAAFGSQACTLPGTDAAGRPAAEPTPLAVAPVAAVEQPLARFIRATGSLMAEEQADVAAETAGRIVATPIERGTAVSPGSELVRVAAADSDAQAKEAEANAAQIEARLGLTPGATFDVNNVAEVRNAKASLDLAQSEFSRIESLMQQKVVSQAEYDQRRTQVEAARQQYESAKNGAAQQYQQLQAARARVAIARKALADTSVRAPFDGLVAERFVSVGDYVTKGMKVASVVRVNPLRIQMTVPEQYVSLVAVGQPVTFEVDAYQGRQFAGSIRYVSPALEANQRALTVEASVPNAKGELKPGLFATALIRQPKQTPAILVPADAVRVSNGTSRVFVVNGDRVEERIVTVGQRVDALLEIVNGLKAGEQVATKNVPQLTDGAKIAL